jgi:monofunctional biosynthetic peptidoglycan transglycosylase
MITDAVKPAYFRGAVSPRSMPVKIILHHKKLFHPSTFFNDRWWGRDKNPEGRFWSYLKILGRLFLIVFGLSVALVICLRWVRPPTSAFILKRHIDNLFAISRNRVDIRHDWVRLDAVSSQVLLAVIAGEDQKFPHHFGFDFESISKAMQYNKNGKNPRGASTITQQTAKNLFLWSGRSYLRKALEAYFTVLLEIFWSKKRILEIYVNIAEFGDGVYGVSAAAEKFFNKHPSRLTRRDAAFLAAVLPNPKAMNPRRPSFYVTERKRWIEEQMSHLGTAYLNFL